MSANVLSPTSAPRRIASAAAQVGVGCLPVVFLLYALLASGCTQPTSAQHAPNLSKVLTHKLVRTSNPPSAGSGDFAALVVSAEAALPDLSSTRGDYSVDVSGTAHATTAGQALAAQMPDDSGNNWWMVAVGANLTSPTPPEMVMIAMPASLWVPGAITLDGQTAIAYLVDATGNPIAYSTSGTLTLTAAPTTLNAVAVGSFEGTFDIVPAPECTTDADCARGQVCAGGTCITPDCSMVQCPAGMVCDPATLDCVVSGCRTDSECGPGYACQRGQCVPSGCQVTGCPAGTTCDPATGACVAPPSCRANSDCPAGFACVNGGCRSCNNNTCAVNGCPAGYLCDLRTGKCNWTGGCRSNSECGSGTVCVDGQCVVQGCLATGCPSGYACDPSTGQCVASGCQATGCPSGYTCNYSSGQCVPASCRSSAECAPGQVCQNGMCVAAGCQVYGCPSGYVCDAASGGCVQQTGPGSCFEQPWFGQGSFSGTAGTVPMCSAADFSNLKGGPDAAFYDGADGAGDPASLLVIGDLTNGGDTYFIAVLNQCPAAGTVLSAPATQLLILKDVVSGDTEVQVQKTASAGTLSFAAGRSGGLTVTLNATFGSDQVTGNATVAP